MKGQVWLVGRLIIVPMQPAWLVVDPASQVEVLVDEPVSSVR